MSPNYYDMYQLSEDATWDLNQAIHSYTEHPPFGAAVGGHGGDCKLVFAPYQPDNKYGEYLSCVAAVGYLLGHLHPGDILISVHGSTRTVGSLLGVGMQVLHDLSRTYKSLIPHEDVGLGDDVVWHYQNAAGNLSEAAEKTACCAMYGKAVEAIRSYVNFAFFTWELLGSKVSRPMSDLGHRLNASVFAEGLLTSEETALSDELEASSSPLSTRLGEFMPLVNTAPDGASGSSLFNKTAKLSARAFQAGNIWAHLADLLDDADTADRLLVDVLKEQEQMRESDSRSDDELFVSSVIKTCGLAESFKACRAGVPVSDLVA